MSKGALQPIATPPAVVEIAARETYAPAFEAQLGALAKRKREIEFLLAGAAIPVLKYAEALHEWVVTNDAIAAVCAQPDQKRKGGRPRGGVAEAARRAPLPKYMSESAKRQYVQRHLRIAGIFPQAKEEAVFQRLDDNQTALLAIAAEATEGAQVEVARTWRFRNVPRSTAPALAETYSLTVPEGLDARRRQKLVRIMKLVASRLRVPIVHANAPNAADSDGGIGRPSDLEVPTPQTT